MKGTTRIKILSLVFIVLAVLAWFALQEKLSINTLKDSEINVAIEDTASINKVIIQKNGVTRVVSRTPNGWVINGKYKTAFRPSALMLVGLNQLQIKRPVAEENKKKVYQEVMAKGAVVTVDYADGKKTMRFLSNPNDLNTTYLIPEGSDDAYIAYVPGISGDINNLFKLEENDWRNKTLFASEPQYIQSIKLSYPASPQDDFEIIYQKGSFSIPGITSLDTAKLESYLNLYRQVSVSNYYSGKTDSIVEVFKKSEQLAKIELVDLNVEKSGSVEIFKDLNNKKEYLGKISSSPDPTSLNKEFFDQLLVKKSYFVNR